MNVHITYKLHKTPDIEKEIHHAVQKLGKRLQVFRPELVHLRGSVEENSPREGMVVSLNLRLPTGQLAAQRSAPSAVAALKAAFDDLLHQVTKHKDLLRTSHGWSRRRSAKEKKIPQVPFEQTLAVVQTPKVAPEDVRSYVNVNLKRLELFVEREIYFREIAGQVRTDAIRKEEVVDEAVARALGDGGERPERLALEAWLYHLAMRALDEMESEVPGGDEIHLEDSARRQNVAASDEATLQFHQPDEAFTEETIIADRRLATPEDLASSDEMLRLVHGALRGVDRRDREAFVLHALEGFSVDEVSGITDRPAEQVQHSIAAARNHLRRSPLFTHSARGSVPGRSATA